MSFYSTSNPTNFNIGLGNRVRQAIQDYAGPSISNFNINVTGAFGLGAANFDAFNRLRVSNPFTLFDSSFLYRDNGLFDTYTGAAGTNGTISFNTDQSSMLLTTTTSNGSTVLRRSLKSFPYQPGKSLNVLCSFVMNPAQTNLTQRVGYYDDSNGLFVELQDSTINFVLRSTKTGVVTEDRISQSNWNIDQFNGSGPSGITLDITKAQILFIDFEWLGVGTVRVGFVIDGKIYYANYFNHANIIDSTYMKTATLPISYEIKNTGVTASTSTLKQICSTVISEGGYDQIDNSSFLTTGLTNKTISHTDITPLFSIRGVSGRTSAIIVPNDVQMLGTSNNVFQYVLVRNASITPALTYVNYDTQTSNVQYALGSNSYIMTGGTMLQQGFVSSQGSVKQSVNLNDPDVFNYQIGFKIDGTSDTVTLGLRVQGNSNGTALATMGWFELN